MGTSNDQTEVVRVLVTLSLLAVFLFGIDPLIFWLAVSWSGVGFWQVYMIWLAVIALGVTVAVLRYLVEDHDKLPPPTPIRRVGRIT